MTTDTRTNSIGWLLQCPPGLAAVLKREMVFAGVIDRKQELFIKKQRNHDLVFANRAKNPDALARLRISEMILRCPIFGRYKISKRQLQTMADELKALGPKRLVISVAGRHFQRHDLARWLAKEMQERGYSFTERAIDDDFDEDDEQPKPRLITRDEVWMFCIDESYYFGIPVTKAREARGARQSERRGSLPAPIAAALAFAGMPKEDDVILDPTCGSGTVLAEAHSYAPGAQLLGIDIDPEAVKIARANLRGLGACEVNEGDSRKLALEPGAVSLVLANLPFGSQFGSKVSNPKLYGEILAELVRVRRAEGWRAILLTSDTVALDAALKPYRELKAETMFRVKIRGELASALRVQERE